MSKFKSQLMSQEDLFYSLANDLVSESEFEQLAVSCVVKLAKDMDLIEYLGGVDAVTDMVESAWYDNNFEHVAV
mgnify:CR=1 FL=1|tara:strand:+ start:120 stop:341 length:222 start_codon:yes stop_codon:yes gene_type:complete